MQGKKKPNAMVSFWLSLLLKSNALTYGFPFPYKQTFTDEGSITSSIRDSARLAVHLLHLVYKKKMVKFIEGLVDPITGGYAFEIDLPWNNIQKEGISGGGALFGKWHHHFNLCHQVARAFQSPDLWSLLLSHYHLQRQCCRK